MSRPKLRLCRTVRTVRFWDDEWQKRRVAAAPLFDFGGGSAPAVTSTQIQRSLPVSAADCKSSDRRPQNFAREREAKMDRSGRSPPRARRCQSARMWKAPTQGNQRAAQSAQEVL